MNAIALLKAQTESAHGNLLAIFGDLSDADAHREPGGRAFSPAANFAHAVSIEDFFVNRVMRGRPPLMDSMETGLSSPLPGVTKTWPSDHDTWARALRVDLPTAVEYASHVFAATEIWLEGLSEPDLDAPVNLQMIGIAECPLGLAYNMLVISHGQNLAGEMSAGKGVLGLRGYPFSEGPLRVRRF